MTNPRNYKWWFLECPICNNLDPIHGKCKCALFKPKSKDGVCVYYEELNNQKGE